MDDPPAGGLGSLFSEHLLWACAHGYSRYTRQSTGENMLAGLRRSSPAHLHGADFIHIEWKGCNAMAEIRAGGEVMNKRPLSAASSLSECSPPNGILKSPASLSFRGAEGDEEPRRALSIFRARFSDFRSPMDSIGVQNSDLAEFTLSAQSEILRFAQDDSEGLGMTAWRCCHTDSDGALTVCSCSSTRPPAAGLSLASRFPSPAMSNADRWS